MIVDKYVDNLLITYFCVGCLYINKYIFNTYILKDNSLSLLNTRFFNFKCGQILV